MPSNPVWEDTVEAPSWNDTMGELSLEQFSAMSERATAQAQQAVADRAYTDSMKGSDLTQAMFVQAPAAIGTALHDAGNALWSGGVNLMANVLDPNPSPEYGEWAAEAMTDEAAKRSYPPAVQAYITGAEGVVKTLPQLGIAAINPVAGGLSFGFTPEGFDPVAAGIGLAAPVIGRYSGAVTELMAAKLGVSSDVALQLFNKLGGATGAAGTISAPELYRISQMPEGEERDRAIIDVSGNAAVMGVMGMMGHTKRFDATERMLEDRAMRRPLTPAELQYYDDLAVNNLNPNMQGGWRVNSLPNAETPDGAVIGMEGLRQAEDFRTAANKYLENQSTREPAPPPASEPGVGLESGKVVADTEWQRPNRLSQSERRDLESRAEQAITTGDQVARGRKERRLDRIRRDHQTIRAEMEDAKTTGDKLRAEIELLELENELRQLAGEKEINLSRPITEADQAKNRAWFDKRAAEIEGKLSSNEPLTNQDRQDWRIAGRDPSKLPAATNLSPVPETTPAPIPATPPRAATPSPAASELGTGEVISESTGARFATEEGRARLEEAQQAQSGEKVQGSSVPRPPNSIAFGRVGELNTRPDANLLAIKITRDGNDYHVKRYASRKALETFLKGEAGGWKALKKTEVDRGMVVNPAYEREAIAPPAPSASPRLSGEPPATPAAAVSKPMNMAGQVRPERATPAPTPEFSTLHPKAQAKFNAAWDANDPAAMNALLHPDNKGLRAEFERRMGIKLPKTVSGTRTEVERYMNAVASSEIAARNTESPAAAVSKVAEHVADVASGAKAAKPEPALDRTTGPRAAKEIKSELVQRLEELVAKIPEPEIKSGKVISQNGRRKFSASLGEVLVDVQEVRNGAWEIAIPSKGSTSVKGKTTMTERKVLGTTGNYVGPGEALKVATGILEKVVYPERAKPITVHIPGDGTFTIEQTHYALSRTLERAKKISTSSEQPQNYTESKPSRAQGQLWMKEAEQSPADATGGINTGALGESGMGGDRGTSAVGDPMMPPLPPGVPGAAHSGGRMPVALERIVPGLVDVPTVMDAFENVIRSVGGDAPIRTGRFYQQARGIFKTFDKVIRLREADNIPTAAHEVAHAVSDKVFGSSGSRALMAAMKGSPLYKQAVAELRALGRALYGSTKPAAGYTAEGFSELTRLWLTTEDAARRAPSANKWLETELFAKLPELKDSMTRAREQVDVWRGQGAEGRAEAMMKGPDSRLTQLRKTLHDSLGMEAQVEELAPLEQLSRGFERITGNRLPPSKDPFMLATAMRGSAGHVLENFVERGVQDIWGNVTGPSLKEAFARLKPQDATQFRDYLRARRSIERWSKNQNPGMTLEDATYLRSKLETPAFIDAAQKYYQWWDGVLEYVKQANPASNSPMIDAVRLGSKDYVPLARVLPESSIRAAQGRLGGGLMKMHGSGLPVKEIYLQSLLTAERLIARAHKDMVLDSVFKLAETEGMGWLVERVPRTKVMEGLNIEKIRVELEKMGVDTTPIPDDTLVQYASHLDRPTGSDPIMVRMVNGKPEWYQVPAGVYDLLSGLDAPRMGKAADLLLGAPNRLFKLGTTGLRASFSLVTNPLRDLPTFFMQSLAGNPASRVAEYIGSLHDIVKAGLTGKESPAWQTFKQLGVSGSNFLGGDIRQAQREARGLFHGKLFRRVASPLETLREAFSFTESAPRLAEMNLVGKEMGWKPGQPMTPDQAIAMTVAAKRITTDFSAGGKVGKYINQAVPFYNASIQGARSFGRAFRKEQGFKTKEHAIAKATLTGLGLLTVPVLFNWWNNKDKDWYRNLPWRERYLYTNVDAGDGTIVQVPRPAEWGNVFMVIPEMMLDSWYHKDPEYAVEGLKHIFTTSNPADFPVLLKIAKEQWQNRIEFFDRPIVPRSEIDLPPGQQRAYFSSIFAKALGDAFPNQISPRRVDAAVRGLFGGLGTDVLDAPGQVMKALGIADAGRPSEPADIPVMGRLFRRGGEFSANGRYLADFWDSYLQHQAKLKGNTYSIKTTGKTTITGKELQSAQILTAYHAAIKLQLDMAQRAKEPAIRQKLYRQASETARRALEASK